MRLVILSDVDMEPMTIVEVPADVMKDRRNGDVIRLMPRLRLPDWREFAACDDSFCKPLCVVNIRIERLQRHSWGGQVDWIWLGYCHDDGLTLKSALLPGQMADYAWEFVS